MILPAWRAWPKASIQGQRSQVSRIKNVNPIKHDPEKRRILLARKRATCNSGATSAETNAASTKRLLITHRSVTYSWPPLDLRTFAHRRFPGARECEVTNRLLSRQACDTWTCYVSRWDTYNLVYGQKNERGPWFIPIRIFASKADVRRMFYSAWKFHQKSRKLWK